MVPFAPLDCANTRHNLNTACVLSCRNSPHQMPVTRGWNCAWTFCVFDLQIKWPQFRLMRFAPRTLTCFQSQALIVGIGFPACGALGGYRAYFLLLSDTWLWPRNTHYSSHPSSSCCTGTWRAHTNRSNTQGARKHSWGLNSDWPG